MSLDRITQGACLGEIEGRVSGRRIERVRPHGPSALKVELSTREALFIDVSRSLGGLWLLTRTDLLPRDDREVEGASRPAALLFKKHLEGARIDAVRGTDARFIALVTSRARVLVRPFGSPGATLLGEGIPAAHFGAGEPVALSDLDHEREVAAGGSEALRLVAQVRATARDERRILLAREDPGLLPLLRCWPESDAAIERLAAILEGTLSPRPFLVPPPGDDATNAETPPALVPFEPDRESVAVPGFAHAGARLYVLRRRADLFSDRTRSTLARSKAEVARLTRLEAALERDRGRWPDPLELRRHAEAMLAAPPEARPGLSTSREAQRIAIPDPRTGAQAFLEVRIQPRLTLPQNADAHYARARNIEGQKAAFEARRAAVLADLEAARATLAEASSLRSLDELDPKLRGVAVSARGGARKSRYLTSRGLEMIFGRNAAENHDVTFRLAKREDLWFHVLDAPGGHVVLRNTERRAAREDIGEAASLAAFLSERRGEASVDVQYTERKHVHPAGGGKGRVRVSHADVIRVAPLDPSGRLRAR